MDITPYCMLRKGHDNIAIDKNATKTEIKEGSGRRLWGFSAKVRNYFKSVESMSFLYSLLFCLIGLSSQTVKYKCPKDLRFYYLLLKRPKCYLNNYLG